MLLYKNKREEIGKDIHPPTAFWLTLVRAKQRQTHAVGSRVQLSLQYEKRPASGHFPLLLV